MSGGDAVSPDELARRSMRRMVAQLVDELHWAIEDRLTVETLHSIVGLWEANNLPQSKTEGRQTLPATPNRAVPKPVFADLSAGARRYVGVHRNLNI